MQNPDQTSPRSQQLHELLSHVQKWQTEQITDGGDGTAPAQEVPNLFMQMRARLSDGSEIKDSDVSAVKEALNYMPDENLLAQLVRKYSLIRQ